VLYRQAGDSNILLEYGEMELDLALRVRVHCLMEAVVALKVDGLIEMSPGVRSLQFQFDFMRLPPQKLIEILTVIEDSLPNAHAVSVPSRIVQMPMAFEDSATLEAVERYRQTVRKTAPWLPNNVDFMQRINGLVSRQEVSAALFEASYLVLGLGDVYLGAPCAVPLDPRHRLVTSKYNPARTHTAEGTVGIGGVYMCIYGMDSPGGYQLVGRTIPIWSRDRLVVEPWLLKPFDQVSFYQVSEEELCKMRKLKDKSRVLKICPTSFSLIEYDAFLNTNHESIEAFKAKQKGAFDEEVKLWEGDTATSGEADDEFCADRNVADDCLQVLATSHCCVWKLLVKTGDAVAAGEDLLILEAMKMEIRVSCPVDGVVVSVMCVSGKVSILYSCSLRLRYYT
jgi:urea carboxylase